MDWSSVGCPQASMLAHAALDPRLDFRIQHPRFPPRRLDRRPNRDAYQSRLLEEPATRPEVARVVRDGYELHARLRCEERARHSVLARLARRHARAFRKYQDPDAGGEPVASLVEYLVDGAVAGAAIDRDALHQPGRPADE